MIRKISLIILACVSMVINGMVAVASERYSKQKVAYHVNYPGEEGDKKIFRSYAEYPKSY